MGGLRGAWLRGERRPVGGAGAVAIAGQGLRACVDAMLVAAGVITWRVTGATPEKPSRCAAAGVRSMIRPLLKGPRSFIRTMTVRPLRKLVTRTIVPKGRERCAAVSFPGANNSPLAVFPSFCE